VISEAFTSLPPTDTLPDEQPFMTKPMFTQHPMENAFHTLDHNLSSKQERKGTHVINRGYFLEPTQRDTSRAYTRTRPPQHGRHFKDLITIYVSDEEKLRKERANNTDRNVTYQLGAQRVKKRTEERERDTALRNGTNKRNGEESTEQAQDRSKQPRRGLDDKLVVSVNIRKNLFICGLLISLLSLFFAWGLLDALFHG
jgi:hypothetical protein